MTIVQIVIYLIIIGVLLWGIQAIPMDATIKRIITVLIIVACLLWLVSALGYGDFGPSLGRHR